MEDYSKLSNKELFKNCDIIEDQIASLCRKKDIISHILECRRGKTLIEHLSKIIWNVTSISKDFVCFISDNELYEPEELFKFSNGQHDKIILDNNCCLIFDDGEIGFRIGTNNPKDESILIKNILEYKKIWNLKINTDQIEKQINNTLKNVHFMESFISVLK